MHMPTCRTGFTSLFPRERGPADPERTIALGELREWPCLWTSDPWFLAMVGDAQVAALLRDTSRQFRYLSATDPNYPHVPLVQAKATIPSPARTDIRDKHWQRLFVEEGRYLPQPGFAAVEGSRIQASNVPWRVHIAALDCRPARTLLREVLTTGVVVIVEGMERGLVAFGERESDSSDRDRLPNGLGSIDWASHVSARGNPVRDRSDRLAGVGSGTLLRIPDSDGTSSHFWISGWLAEIRKGGNRYKNRNRCFHPISVDDIMSVSILV